MKNEVGRCTGSLVRSVGRCANLPPGDFKLLTPPNSSGRMKGGPSARYPSLRGLLAPIVMVKVECE